MGGSSNEPADEIEREEADPAHAVFDVVSEDPEVEQVKDQVGPAAVEEHRGQGGHGIYGLAVNHACHAVTEGYPRADFGHPRYLAGDHSVIADTRGKGRLIHAGPLNQYPGCDVCRDYRVRHHWWPHRTMVVADRDQILSPFFLDCSVKCE